jgi:hypothetical protein
MSELQYPTEVISLPSQGKVYPESNPLSSGEIEIKYMTAKEEEILASQNLIKKGVVLDKLFESIIVDKKINPNDIIIGDKNAIMLATRILGYGSDYQIEVMNDLDEKSKVTVDLAQIQTKEVDVELLNTDNKFTFTTPVGGNILEFKLLTHGDEQKIDADVKAMQRLNKDGASSELTTRYRYMILSVDGKNDTQTINNFVNNRFLTRDTKAFREYVKSISPDVNMEFEYEDPQTGEKEVRPIPMGVNFFWPAD